MRWPIGNYRRHPAYDKTKCVYCGVTEEETSLCDDHWPPRNRKYEFPDFKHWYVRACLACNSKLSNTMQATLEERAKVAKGEVPWTDLEITGTQPRESKLNERYTGS